MKGTVSNLIESKKFGFIHGENGQEYFFHRDDIDGHWDRLVELWKQPKTIIVSFDAMLTPKGPRASFVSIE